MQQTKGTSNKNAHDLTPANLAELLSLPGDLFVKAAYQHILYRDVDEEGLLYHLQRLSEGVGKETILISMIKSRERQALVTKERKREFKQPLSDLERELERLAATSKTSSGQNNIFEGRINKKFNAMAFKMETNSNFMFDRMQDKVIQDLSTRVGEMQNNLVLNLNTKIENMKSAIIEEVAAHIISELKSILPKSDSEIIREIQSRRRDISRPVGKN